MAGIKNIRDLYKKVGEKGLREVLEGEIRVTEKFDAYRFAFEKNPHDYKIYFYGKNGKTPLSKIDRTVSDLYEAAIASIENLPAEVKKAIPPRHRFGFSWFPTSSPLNTEYERRPKKGLVLTDITIRNRERDVTRDVKETQVFERWSGIFGVETNTPIYEGKLDENTINGLIEMAKNDYALTSLNESSVYTHGMLNENSANVEALIFEADGQLFKVADVEENEKVAEKRSHLFDILLLDICEFLNESQLEGIKPVSLHSDEAYIEVVSEIFNSYVENRGKSFLTSGLEKPKFLEKSGRFNREWVKNPKTRAIIESNRAYEYLLSIFITNLRKPKYPSGLLSEAVVNTFNSQIEEISRICEDDYSFLEFTTIVRENEVFFEKSPLIINPAEEAKKQKVKDAKLPDIEKSVLLLHTFFNGAGITEKREPVEVFVCNCAMATNRLIAQAENAFKESGKRGVIVHSVQRDKLKLETSVVEKILSRLVEDRNDLFIGYRILDVPLLELLLKKLGAFYPHRLHCESDLHGDTMMELISRSASKGAGFTEFEVKKLPTRIYQDCLSALEKEDLTAFKKCMPEPVHTYWNTLKSAYDKQTYY